MHQCTLGVRKKIKKSIKLKKPKNKTEKTQPWKKTSRFDFDFISLKPKKPNRTQTEKNRVKLKKPIQTGFCPKKPNRTETGWFEPVLVRFF